jgi:glycerate-2-kinase
MINIIISDSVGDRPTLEPNRPTAFFGTPVAPDRTTLREAQSVLRRYDLTDTAPRSVQAYLADGSHETPKAFGERVSQYVIAGVADSAERARAAAEKCGITPVVLTTFLEGESREAATFLSSVAREVRFNGRPAGAPCVLIASGETTTRLDGDRGLGGPSQELALAFALEVAGLSGICAAALDTDGTDGPTTIAGALVDAVTVERGRAAGLDGHEHLKRHDSGTYLSRLGDTLITGNTGTNVCDLNLVYIG